MATATEAREPTRASAPQYWVTDFWAASMAVDYPRDFAASNVNLAPEHAASLVASAWTVTMVVARATATRMFFIFSLISCLKVINF